MLLTRRKFFSGAGLLIAAPAIVRASSLMPVKAFLPAAELPFFVNIERAAGNLTIVSWSTPADYPRFYDVMKITRDGHEDLMVRAAGNGRGLYSVSLLAEIADDLIVRPVR